MADLQGLEPAGRLELTWTNKHLRLLARPSGSYEWTHPGDYRVAVVRLLHDAGRCGDVQPDGDRARDNLLIRGDALHALTALTRLGEFAGEYLGKVRLAYLDPPFNTKQAFQQYDDALEHSVWLTMMRDRLAQVRELLAPDGSVWVHLDDAEVHYCRVLLDEIFGRSCFMGSVVWRSTDNSNNDARTFSNDHNVLLVYGREPEWRSVPQSRNDQQSSHYSNPDNDPRGPWFDGNPLNSPNPRDNLRYSITSPQGIAIQPPQNGWRWSRETLDSKIETGEVRFTKDGRGIRRRTYLREQPGLPPSSLWADIEETGSNRRAKTELKRLFPGTPTADLFATPKPEALLAKIVNVATLPGDVVLDCFLGSGTTAAVATKLGRRWVGVEWSASTLQRFTMPRLQRVLAGDEPDGALSRSEWPASGGYRVLDVAPSMFAVDDGRVVLAEWAVGGALQEAVAAQAGYAYRPDPPFCGHKGRTRLAVVDGLVNEDACRLLVSWLDEDERLCVYGTAVDPAARAALALLRRGSTVKRIPQSVLADYQRDWGATGLGWPDTAPPPRNDGAAAGVGA